MAHIKLKSLCDSRFPDDHLQVCSEGRREGSELQEAAGAGVEIQDGGGNSERHHRLVQGCWNPQLMMSKMASWRLDWTVITNWTDGEIKW